MKKIASSDPACHNCNLNYTGSSPGKEIAGATKIFSSSKGRHGFYYTSFYGHGGCKAYPAVEDMCGQTKPITKFECVGHYQKRVGSRLRHLKKNTGGLGGKRKLTDTKIDMMQNYFGIGLRSNVTKVTLQL